MPPDFDDPARWGSWLVSLHYPEEQVRAKTAEIHAAVQRDSPHLRQGNFERIGTGDLRLLYEQYDRLFFEGTVRQALALQHAPLRFRLSRRLTRSAGLTTLYSTPALEAVPPDRYYEITISTTLLYQTFQDLTRAVHVNGVLCADRLEALQRVFEHELLHLGEMLAFGRSSCAAEPFTRMAWNIFAHPETRHELITQHERAASLFQVRVGDRVAFTYEGQRFEGVVNRITRRATVLVESPAGAPYRDGKRYLKFYIPLEMLEKPGPGGGLSGGSAGSP